jgi:nuclear transport factor 2 (NTF2) superfamily protein
MKPETMQGASASARSPRDLIPPFTLDTALAKVRAAEDAWNSRDPERVALAYSPDSEWRNRDTFVQGRDAIRAFLQGKWDRELDYRLAKSIWGFRENRIAVRFQYEWRDAAGALVPQLRQRAVGVRRRRA